HARSAWMRSSPARTFGMDAFFPTAKIYNPKGQNYLSVDRDLVLAYKESPAGQLIHPGINEAGAVAAFTAAGTSYATHGVPLVPVYVFYSMFGFQRTGDAFWAAADQMTRGFIIGATAGRTTLTGEGLQHADGHSPLLASTNPAVLTYDPAYGYEIGHIIRSGLERMYGPDSTDKNVMYYLTVYNEPIVQPAEPENLDIEGVIKGIYLLAPAKIDGPRTQILASGVSVPWAIEAQRVLADDWNVSADVWSVTSWNELRRDGLAAEEEAFLNPGQPARTPFVTQQLEGATGPIVAVSDYMKAVPDQIRQFVPNEFATLGADGFGFSDTRAAARRYFKNDTHSIVVRSSPTNSPPSAPTASASPTPAQQPAATSRTTPTPSWCVPLKCWRAVARWMLTPRSRPSRSTSCSTSMPAPPAMPGAKPSLPAGQRIKQHHDDGGPHLPRWGPPSSCL
ncbi:transketolase-like TK C-terminal-containing protein, partial [Arthrobacter sp. Soil761]|uniref:transketolase-like TK C-terminal-containing protein n=1 Tax=Arthrobacter sp. Soil761 TaxID=1736400 RepID=UPI0039C96617